MLSVENVDFRYAATAGDVLRGVNLRVAPGELVLLTGPSGAGKSTLLDCVNGLGAAAHGGEFRGCIRFGEEGLGRLAPWERSRVVATVRQNPATQFFQLNVGDELAFTLEYRDLSVGQIAERVASTSRAMQIDHLLHRDIFSLSSGERQRVALAAMHATHAPLLLFDEPTANLDAPATDLMLACMARFKRERRAILVVEHRLDAIRSVADRLVVIDGGRVVYDGPLDALDDEAFCSRHCLRHSRARSFIELPPGAHHPDDARRLSARDVRWVSRRKTVLDNAALLIRGGECVGIRGTNGAGKTSMARALCGLEKKARGRIDLDGREFSPAKMLGRVAYVAQQSDRQLFTDSVRRELSGGGATTETVNELLDRFHLTALADRHPQALSGGERQRVAIAAAMASDPEFLILDEPTGGMDGGRFAALVALLRDLTARGVGLLLITHDLELLHAACDRAVEMREGRVVREWERNEFELLDGAENPPAGSTPKGEGDRKAALKTLTAGFVAANPQR
ncbi:MAG: ABC transporter ATP-binding protein [Deltaproteobacteria bacterium]|nr:ABC transporter ATP-binding protein [Deltaproteobacteria bacterium]